MRISTYNPRVQGSGPAAPTQPGSPHFDTTERDGALAFSQELKRTSAVAGQLLLDHQNKVRTNAIRSQRNNAMNAFDEYRLEYQREYFSEDTAFNVNPDTGELNYITGLSKMEENFNTFIEENLSKGFTYSEAYEMFQEAAESKRVGFEHDMRVMARQREMEWNVQSLNSRADALQDQGNADELVVLYQEAAEGTLSPVDATQQLAARLKQMEYNEALEAIRAEIDADSDLETILEMINGFEDAEWGDAATAIAEYLGVEDVPGLDEAAMEGAQRFGVEDLNQLRSAAQNEWKMHRDEKIRIQAEYDREGHELAQREWHQDTLNNNNLMDPEHPIYSRMSWRDRQYWMDRKEQEDQMSASARSKEMEEAALFDIYSKRFAGADLGELEALALQYGQQGIISSSAYRGVQGWIGSNAYFDALGDGNSFIAREGKNLGLSEFDIKRAQHQFGQSMIEEGFFIIDDETGMVEPNPDADPNLNQHVLERARSFIQEPDFQGMLEGMQSSRSRNDGAYQPGSLSESEAVDIAISEGWFMYVKSPEEAARVLTQLEHTGLRMGQELFGRDPSQVYRTRTGEGQGRSVYRYTFDVPIPADPASGDLPGQTVQRNVDITYKARIEGEDDEGNPTSGQFIPHIRVQDRNGNHVWRPIESRDGINQLMESMGQTHRATSTTPAAENTFAAREGVDNLHELFRPNDQAEVNRELRALEAARRSADEEPRTVEEGPRTVVPRRTTPETVNPGMQ